MEEKIQLVDKDYTAIVMDLQERVQKLETKKLGNPAVVGLAGFGMTTMILQFHNFDHELMTMSPVVWLGLFFGGLAQLVAGLQEFQTGNNFGYSAFTTYGAFWISLASMIFASNKGLLIMTNQDMGLFLIGFTIYTFIVLVASMRLNCALFICLMLLFIGFVFLDVAQFHPSVSSGFKKAAGSVLFVCALMAWYVMAHLLYKDAFGRDILPVGPPPLDFKLKFKFVG